MRFIETYKTTKLYSENKNITEHELRELFGMGKNIANITVEIIKNMNADNLIDLKSYKRAFKFSLPKGILDKLYDKKDEVQSALKDRFVNKGDYKDFAIDDITDSMVTVILQ